MSLLSQFPLPPEAAAFKRAILAIPRTHDALPQDFPEGVTLEQMARLHDGATSGANWVIPELKRLAARCPDFPIPLNYLKNVYQVQGKHRQARETVRQQAERFPNYLFTRLGLFEAALERGDSADAAAGHLGPECSLTALYPERGLFHVSEIIHFYYCVGRVHAMRGDPDMARAVLGAIEELLPDHPAVEALGRDIMAANIASMQLRMERDRAIRRAVTVAQPPEEIRKVGRPEFNHPVVGTLYEYGFELPEQVIGEILALPRQTIIADLLAVIDNAIDRGPAFLVKQDFENSEIFPIHALHLLGEMGAAEAIEPVLRFLSIHPTELQFWIEDGPSNEALSGIFGDGCQRLAEFLTTPGIGPYGKEIVADAIVFRARHQPQTRDAAIAAIGGALEIIANAKPEDNLLDTRSIASLICSLVNLRAVSMLPLITRIYDLGLIEEVILGDLASVTEDIKSPADPPGPIEAIIERYARFLGGDEADEAGFDPDEDDYEDDLPGIPSLQQRTPASDLYSLPDPSPIAGRNDPCPCGSGKKYKKCCM